MKAFALLLLLPAFAQDASVPEWVIPHITQDNASFSTTLIVENRALTDTSYTLRAFASNGQPVKALEITMASGERKVSALADLFGDMVLSHLTLIVDGRVEDIFPGVAYTPLSNPKNRAFVPAIRSFTQAWRIEPGNLDQTFDGLAVVALSCGAPNLALNQYSQDGALLSSVPFPIDAGYGKQLINLANWFNTARAAYAELQADSLIAVTALRGSLDMDNGMSFMVGNLATPLPGHGALLQQLQVNRNRWRTQELYGNHLAHVAREEHGFAINRTEALIHVRENQLQTMMYVDGGFLSAGEARTFKTIDELFDFIQDMAKDNRQILKVDFHEDMGYPQEVTLVDTCSTDIALKFEVISLSPVLREN